MTTENPALIKFDFYALGKTNQFHQTSHLTSNVNHISNYSNNILERNALSLNSSNLESIRNNFKNQHSVTEIQNKETNNYLNPINMYRSKDIYKINSNFSNKETFNVLREKYFANDLNSGINNQKNLSKEEFIKKKFSVDNAVEKPLPELIPNNTQKTFKENTFYFDKSAKKIIRYEKGFWDYNEKYMIYYLSIINS